MNFIFYVMEAFMRNQKYAKELELLQEELDTANELLQKAEKKRSASLFRNTTIFPDSVEVGG